jgi:hypothetical protein
MSDSDDLKKQLLDGMSESLGAIWNSKEDKEFLEHTSEHIAKYLYVMKTSTELAKQDALYNLRMLQSVMSSYLAQKVIIAQHGPEAIVRSMLEAMFRVLIAVVP